MLTVCHFPSLHFSLWTIGQPPPTDSLILPLVMYRAMCEWPRSLPTNSNSPSSDLVLKASEKWGLRTNVTCKMVNGLHLYSAFIQSALQFLPLVHPFTHQRRLAAMQGTNQLVRSNWGLGVLLRDTSTRPGWDQTGNPPTARRQLYLLSHIAHVKLCCVALCVMLSLRCITDTFIQRDKEQSAFLQ